MGLTGDEVHSSQSCDQTRLTVSFSKDVLYSEFDEMELEQASLPDSHKVTSFDEAESSRPSFVKRSGYNVSANACALSIFLVLFLALAAGISVRPSSDLDLATVKDLIPGFKGEIFYPGSAEYEKQIKVKFWPLWQRRPIMVVQPNDEADVSLALSLVLKIKRSFTILSGGNSYAGWAVNSGGVCISMKNMTDLQVDEQGVVTLGPGVTSGQAMEFLVPKAWGIVFSNWPAVGMGGFIQGGGFGVNSRSHGLAIDELVSARIALGNGSVVLADRTHNSDLFWALRGGGGGNWGVVTQYKIQAKKEIFVVGHVDVSTGDLKEYFVWLAEHAAGLKKNLGMLVHCGYVQHTCQTWFQWIAPLDNPGEEIDAGVKYIREDFVGRLPVTPTAFEIFRDGIPNPASGGSETLFWSRTFFIPSYNAAEGAQLVSDAFLQTYNQHPQFARLYLELWGGQIATRTADETAFYWRNSQFLCGIEVDVDSTLADAKEQFQATSASIMSHWTTLLSEIASGGFVNYQDWTLSAEDALNFYYGGNLPRLRRIKAHYDPSNMFKFEQSVPPRS